MNLKNSYFKINNKFQSRFYRNKFNNNKNCVFNNLFTTIRIRKKQKKFFNVKNNEIIQFNNYIKQLILKKNACVKCFCSNYQATNKNALCKTESLINVKKTKTKFAALNIF